MYGSAVWTEEGHVLGLFKYAHGSGAMGIGVWLLRLRELLNWDFTLADTANRNMPDMLSLPTGALIGPAGICMTL